MQRNRLAYAGWIGLTIVAGLASRSSASAAFMPGFIRTYAGDTLWALMVFFMLGFLFPRARTWALAGAALGISFAVEFSQLYQADWLNRLRATLPGALILGRGWVATDLLCYSVGVGMGVVVEASSKWRKSRAAVSSRMPDGGA